MATLLEQRQTLLDQANAVYKSARADDRSLTDDEERAVTGYLDGIESLDESIARSERMTDIFAKLNSGPDVEEPEPGQAGAFPVKGHLSLATVAPKAFAAMRKAPVAAGSTVVEVELIPGIIPAGRAPLTLLDAISAVRRSSPVYRTLTESTHTPNAGVVASGAVKPTSVFAVSSVDAHLRVVATLSEALDRMVLADSPALRQLLDAELVDAVRRAIEDEVVNGDGTGEHFLGLESLSGVQTVTGAVDLLTGLRSSVTKLQNASIAPSFFAVNPTDLETAQTTRNASGGYDWAPDQPIDAGRSQAWGVPIIPTPAVPALTAWAIGENSIQLSTDAALLVDWGTPGDTFTRNQVVLRAETRANLDALRVVGLCKVTIAP